MTVHLGNNLCITDWPLPQSLSHPYSNIFHRQDRKVMWLGWFPTSSTWSLAWTQKRASSGYISLLLAVLAVAIPVVTWEIPLCQIINWLPNTPYSVVSFSTLRFCSAQPAHSCSHAILPLVYSWNLLYFPFSGTSRNPDMSPPYYSVSLVSGL